VGRKRERHRTFGAVHACLTVGHFFFLSFSLSFFFFFAILPYHPPPLGSYRVEYLIWI